MNTGVPSIPQKSLIKILISSLLLWWSIVWAWYTILFSSAWTFSQQPLVVSVLIWMSAIILFSTWRVVSVKKYLSLRNILFWMSAFSVLCVIIAYIFLDQSFQWLLRVFVWLIINILVLLLINAKYTASTIYRTASSMRISLAWNNMFALWTALIGAVIVSLSIMSKPLTCEYIYSRYDSITESPMIPLSWSQQSLESIGEQSVFTLLKDYRTQGEENQEEQIAEETNNSSSTSLDNSENNGWWTWIESAFITAKQSIIDETLEQRSVVTQNVCQLVLWQIEDIRKTATRNISIVILLLVVLSPLITLRFRLVSYISRWIFKILVVFGVFSSKKKVITVNELE